MTTNAEPRPTPIRRTTADRMAVELHPDELAVGRAAAACIGAALRTRLARQDDVRMVFAAAPSQNSVLDSLCVERGVDWSRVTAFHLDEYLGAPPTAPHAFGRYLVQRVFERVRPGRVHLIDGSAEPVAECRRYADLLAAAPIDIAILGIGENGHIAFNEPGAAFDTPSLVEVVTLHERSRQQQVTDGSFDELEAVPRKAITLTIPALLSAGQLVVAVTGDRKREAVRRALDGVVDQRCPATALRRHARCTLFVDTAAAGDAI